MSQFVTETDPLEQILEALQYRGGYSGGLPLNSYSNVLENTRTVLAGQGKLLGISGLNTKVAAQFILVFDKATPVANGDVPVFVMTAAASSNFGVFWGDIGRWFTRGVQLANSSTAATLTLGAADCWFDAQYI
jgi:hypothetical protein